MGRVSRWASTSGKMGGGSSGSSVTFAAGGGGGAALVVGSRGAGTLYLVLSFAFTTETFPSETLQELRQPDPNSLNISTEVGIVQLQHVY